MIILRAADLSVAATVMPGALCEDWVASRTLDCAWLPGVRELAVFSDSFKRFAVVSTAAWDTAPELVSLQGTVTKPQWGYKRLAASTSDGSALMLYAHEPDRSMQLIATLPAAIPVSSSIWAGLTATAWHPGGRWVASVSPAASTPASDLALVLHDSNRAGAVVWSYTLRGTRGAASPGLHHIAWNADGTGLTVGFTASYLRRWHLGFKQEGQHLHKCFHMVRGRRGDCPECEAYWHKPPEAYEPPSVRKENAASDMMSMMYGFPIKAHIRNRPRGGI